MTPERQTQSPAEVAELKKLFGPPPILSTENKEHYEAMRNHFIECLQPEDFVVLMLVHSVLDSEFEILRLQRHKVWAIDRRFRKRLENQAARRAANERRAKEMARRAEDLSKAATGTDRLWELQDVVETTVEDVDRILDVAAQECDHAQGLEDAFDYYEKLDRALTIAFSRRNDFLQQIWQYRADLGELLRRKCEIIEGEFKTISPEAGATEVPLVPAQTEDQP